MLMKYLLVTVARSGHIDVTSTAARRPTLTGDIAICEASYKVRRNSIKPLELRSKDGRALGPEDLRMVGTSD